MPGIRTEGLQLWLAYVERYPISCSSFTDEVLMLEAAQQSRNVSLSEMFQATNEASVFSLWARILTLHLQRFPWSIWLQQSRGKKTSQGFASRVAGGFQDLVSVALAILRKPKDFTLVPAFRNFLVVLLSIPSARNSNSIMDSSLILANHLFSLTIGESQRTALANFARQTLAIL